ncbi:DinB family protein [Flavobacterium humi]|uniref:DinB family protein n=1 Tax=Flavobacterium humi TaxID=2562683 RepID=A0A4Z0LA94_9FLAO|nr:DinB family protein [Flavobacterium humi]TGD58170.1 DinB family protein [Flavobacterium humi]
MNANQTMVKMILDRWHAMLGQFETALNSLSDEQLQHEISPGKNRGIYLLGHLIAVHDDMIAKLDFGKALYPELEAPFITSPDKAVAELPSAASLRAKWTELHTLLNGKINSLQPEEWFQKHTVVSAEDFAKEPHRNKLNIVNTRTNHLSYHLGQFILIQ